MGVSCKIQYRKKAMISEGLLKVVKKAVSAVNKVDKPSLPNPTKKLTRPVEKFKSYLKKNKEFY